MERIASFSAVRVSGLFLLVAVHGSGYAEASVSTGALQDVSSALTRLSPTPLFDSAEHPDAAVSELGALSRGLILSEERIVLLDGRALLFLNPWTDELWTAGGEGGGPGEFAGSGLEISWFRKQDGLTTWDLNNDFRLTEFSDEGDVLATRRLDLSRVEFEHWTAVSALGAVFDDGKLLFLDGGYSVVHDAGGRFRKYVVEVGMDGGRRTIAEFAGEEAGAARDEAQARARSSHENMVEQLHTIGRSTEGLAFRERERGESLLDACGDLLLLRIRSGLGVDRAVIRELDRGTGRTP